MARTVGATLARTVARNIAVALAALPAPVVEGRGRGRPARTFALSVRIARTEPLGRGRPSFDAVTADEAVLKSVAELVKANRGTVVNADRPTLTSVVSFKSAGSAAAFAEAFADRFKTRATVEVVPDLPVS